MAAKLRKFYETGNQVNDEPLVCVFEDFISDAEVEALLAAASPKLKQALVSAEKSGVLSEGRTGKSCWVPHGHNEVIAQLSLRIAEVVGIGLENAESMQVIHYDTEEQYAPHYDAWDKATERGRRCMARGGQRVLTCLLYLNDVQGGGGTSFPNLDMEIQAKRGRMLLFHNCVTGSTQRHPDSLHGGMPVLEGEKWACNFWFRELEFQDSGSVPTHDESNDPPKKFSRVI